MSIEIGVPSKTIRYLNLHKEGTHGQNNFCSIDSRWRTPVIDKLDEYTVAVSRFQVPANRLAMTQKLEKCIEIFKYPEDDVFGNDAATYRNVEQVGVTMNGAIAAMRAVESDDANNMTKGDGASEITMEECFTIYEFLKKLNAKITEVLLFNSGAKAFVPNGKGDGSWSNPASGNLNHRNMFSQTYDNSFEEIAAVLNNTDPIAYFKICMDSDWTFSVEMNYEFAQKYYIKMSKALFNMLGFKEGMSFEVGKFRADMTGYRFMGSRHYKTTQNPTHPYVEMHKQVPPYVETTREVGYFDKTDRISDYFTWTPAVVQGGTRPPLNSQGSTRGYILPELNLTASRNLMSIRTMMTTFNAAISVADSINRIKSLVFTSSLATVSEGGSGGTFLRMLTDYTIPVKTSFTFDPYKLTGTVSENAASEYTFTCANPSAGRFLQLSDPSPLYEIKVEVLAKAYNYETDEFDVIPIPLPIGGTFSMKLVFISKNDIHRRHRPDSMKA